MPEISTEPRGELALSFTNPGSHIGKYFYIRIQTIYANYGCFLFEVNSKGQFEPYEPFLENLANTVALTMELRSHESQLQKANEELLQIKAGLETVVNERTSELILRNNDLQRWGHIFEHAGWGILVCSPGTWSIEVMNPTIVSMVGSSVEELIGQTYLNFFEPESIPEARENIRLAQDTGHHSWESLHMRKDGSHFPVLIDISTIKDERRDNLYLVVNIQDITLRKNGEEKIYRLNAELENRVRERTKQLEDANKEMESFSYSVSHDLRAPLRSLDGYSSLLLEEYKNSLDEQGQLYLARIKESSHRMGNLIDDLLMLSRISRRELSLRQVDLSALAQQISTELALQNPQRCIEFEIASGMVVTADQNLIAIALENLLNNSCKYTMHQEHPKIRVGVQVLGDEPAYYVQDNGVGFDMKFAERLFKPFQRLHSEQEFPGTGIGLVTVHRIITRHGGRIWPEAQPNRGATFYFTLGKA